MKSSLDRRWPPGRRRGLLTCLLTCLICLLCVSRSSAICPAKCVCNDKLLEAGCENSSLEVVPIQLNPEIKLLRLTNNRIVNIHLTLSFYTHLNELDLSFNKIKSLGAKNFEFQMNLMNLNLSSNSIRQLHRDSFKGLRNLFVLDLSRNYIEVLEEKSCFKDLGKLQELDLSRNNIYSVESGMFDYLLDLRRLVLSQNQLLRVPADAINNLVHLKELDLTWNLIDEVSFPANLKELEVLRLRSNLLSSLHNETFVHLAQLKLLDLSDNNFTQVPTLPLSKLHYLEHLNVSLNLFRSLGPNSFRNLYKLTEIYIDRVATLTKIDAKFLMDNINLEHISLSNSVNLRHLPKYLFMNKPHLKHVSIAGNDFSTLDASDLPLDQLETLQLGRNPFRCNCSLLWLWILKEKQVDTNCSCTEVACFERCVENSPKTAQLRGDESSEEYEEEEEEETARFQGFTYNRDIFPIILDLDEVYCAGHAHSPRIPLKIAPKSDFDCNMTWLLILTIAILAIIIIFFIAVVIYIVKIRCRRKAKNPVEDFINATKTYEDTHHTYYRYGQNLQNGDVFEILKTDQKIPNCATNMYIKSPVTKESISYPYTLNTFKNEDPNVKRPYKKQFSNPNIPESYSDSSNFSIKNFEANIYQEPFAGPLSGKPQRAPHIVYV